jgi:superfamily II DNA helicase RecQ
MIFIDEAHLVMTTAYYRPDMLYTPTLIKLGALLTLLSATIPEYMEIHFSTTFHVEFATIRACTNRPNWKYSVKVSDRLFDDVVDTMMVYQGRLAHSNHRCIAYCMTRKDVDELCRIFHTKSISVSGYHVKMNVQD